MISCSTVLMLQITSTLADDDKHRSRVDHDIARAALIRGEILPLEAILAEVKKTVVGEFVGVELSRRQNIWIYTIKVISPTGAFDRVLADAKTGVVIKTKRDH